MIDVHHHLIWGVDDGPPDLDTSLDMARMAIDDGITHIVCTPHASDAFPYQAQIIQERFDDLRARLDGQINLSLACDFHLTFENIVEARQNFPRYSIDGKGYLMVEFDSRVIPQSMDQMLFKLSAAGYTIIITHPERYQAVLRRPEMIAHWMQAGYLIQITASSFFGRFGKHAEALAKELLERDWIHFLASDAHNISSRPPLLKKAFEYVTRHRGQQTAHRLFHTNPQAALLGLDWPVQPIPVGLWENTPLHFHLSHSLSEAASQPRDKKKPLEPAVMPPKSFWKRLFSR